MANQGSPRLLTVRFVDLKPDKAVPDGLLHRDDEAP
jgi:hypothetical protein